MYMLIDKLSMTWYHLYVSLFSGCLVAQLCLTLCDPMDCSTPGFPVHHQFPDHAQTHVHWVSDAIQPSHLLLSPSSPVFNLSQHLGLFQWVSSSLQVAKVSGASASASVLLRNIHSWFPLGLTGLIFLLSNRLLTVISSTTTWKHQFSWHSVFLMVQLSHLVHTNGKTIALTIRAFVSKMMSLLLKMLSLP